MDREGARGAGIAKVLQSPPVSEPAELFPEIPEPKRRAYLAAFAETGQVGRSCKIAGIDPKTAWNWQHRDPVDPEYVRALETAEEMAGRTLEAEAIRRARDGWLEPVFHQGVQVGEIRKYSDTLLIFTMKGAMPAKYRERFEHSGPDGGPIQTQNVVDLTKLSAPTLRKILDELEQ